METPGKRIAGGRYEMSAVIAGVWDRRRLTTPHKLQAEAGSRKRASRRPVVCPPRKPMAEACQLHAVVSRHQGTALPLSKVLKRWDRCGPGRGREQKS